MENINVEKVKASHRKIYTDIIINAPKEKVWKVLSDTSNYKNWATFLVEIDGEIKDNGKIIAKFQMNPDKEKFNTIEHTISVDEGSEFYWAEKGPMGITDNHHFKIESIDENTSKFIQSDELKGGMTWLLGGMLTKNYAKGYQAFNRKLKQQVENS